MNTKHTPGPWQLMPVNNTYKICTADGERFVKQNHYLAGEPFICDVNDDFSGDGEHSGESYERVSNPKRCLANANLIAAAPELFSLVQEKTGADCFCQSHGTCWNCRARAAIAKATGGEK